MHKDISTSKVFYRPIEAAIRWAGLLRYLPMILATIASPRVLPRSLNCPRWNEEKCPNLVYGRDRSGGGRVGLSG